MEGQSYLDLKQFSGWQPCNPKMVGSGVVACRPQVGPCPNRCADCFFGHGRYYEDIWTPHIPDPKWVNENHLIVRMNDGNDSNYCREMVMEVAKMYNRVFFNTSKPQFDFGNLGPVVFTANGRNTDGDIVLVESCSNLMTVRIRLNTWNVELVRRGVEHYTARDVPVLLTFMAYYAEKCYDPDSYEWKKRTKNPYWCVKPEARIQLEEQLGVDGNLIRTCTTRESHFCKDCGNCKLLYERWESKHGRWKIDQKSEVQEG